MQAVTYRRFDSPAHGAKAAVCLFSFLLLFCAAMPAPGQKPVPPVPKPKPVQKMLDWSKASEYPNVRFRFRTTVATAPVVYLSEKVIDGKHIDPKIIIARKTGTVGNIHNIQVSLPKANKDKTYHFVVIIDGEPKWTDTIEV